jgi:hypothetical protein
LIRSHTYYTLPLIPILALSLAPLATLVLDQIVRQPICWKPAFLAVSLIAFAYPAIVARNTLVVEDFREDVDDELSSKRCCPPLEA